MSVAVLVPVLGRPQRVKPLLDSLAKTAPDAAAYFLPDPDDGDEIRAIQQARGSMFHTAATGYAQKVNEGVRLTHEPLVFLAADDIEFRPGWLENAKARMKDGIQVVGVNDLIERRPGREGHATHFLMTREYAQQPCIDGSRGPLHEGYDHSFVDDELIATATKRGVYAYAEDSHVKHDHPMAGGEDDDTYRKGRRMFRFDRRLFARRAHLWT